MTSRSGLSLSRMPSWRIVWRRLDERAPDVGVLDQALAVGDAGALRVADGGGGARLRRRDDEVGLDGVLDGQPPPDLDAGGVHRAARDRGVRARQVDVLEHAALRLRCGEPRAAHAVGVDGQQLAGLDLAHERRADDVQRGRLARDHPAALEPPEDERADAVRIAGGVEGGLVGEDQRVRPAQPGQEPHRGLLDADVGRRGREQLGDEVGVGAGAHAAAVAEGVGTSSRSSAVLTRLPLWPSAMPLPAAVVRNVGWAFSQVVDPVVE